MKTSPNAVKIREKPLVSVVIPTFNREQTISYCLNSVLAQTYENIEVIVVDDCSTDTTVDVVKSFTDLRVRHIALEKNSGAQAARNRGIKESTGDWIAFQDSDDEWMPEKLEKQVEALSEANFDPLTLVHCAAIRCEVNKRKEEILNRSVLEGSDLYSILLSSSPPLYPTMLVSKLALDRIGYLDESVPSHQEWETAIRLSKVCRFIYIKKPLMIYHIHSHIRRISEDKIRDAAGNLYVIEKFKEDIVRYCGKEVLSKNLCYPLQILLDLRRRKQYCYYSKLYGLKTYKSLRQIYLKGCYLLHLRPTNFLYIKLRKLLNKP